MITIISPAKLLEEKTKYPDIPHSMPALLDQASELVNKLKKCSAKKLGELMDISHDLSELNKKRFLEWYLPFTPENSKQAILTFSGDVYRGMNATSFSEDDLGFAQKHLRILSGLYGLLKPLDLIQPYRLMMGTPFAFSAKQKNLYAFWGETIMQLLQEDLNSDRVLINLASAEYFKAVVPNKLNANIITCDFKELKNGRAVGIQTFTKLARGYMARFIVQNRINTPGTLKEFNEHGYHFDPNTSTSNNWIYVR